MWILSMLISSPQQSDYIMCCFLQILAILHGISRPLFSSFVLLEGKTVFNCLKLCLLSRTSVPQTANLRLHSKHPTRDPLLPPKGAACSTPGGLGGKGLQHPWAVSPGCPGPQAQRCLWPASADPSRRARSADWGGFHRKQMLCPSPRGAPLPGVTCGRSRLRAFGCWMGLPLWFRWSEWNGDSLVLFFHFLVFERFSGQRRWWGFVRFVST